jgi:hypothetical protein
MGFSSNEICVQGKSGVASSVVCFSRFEPNGAGLPIALRLDHREKFAEVRASGTVTLEDVLGYSDSLVAQGAMSYA